MDNRLSWYPGHIKAARQEIRKRFKKINVLVEMIDARAAISSQSGIFDGEVKNHILIINKCDLVSKEYVSVLKEKFSDRDVIFISALRDKNVNSLLKKIENMSAKKNNKLAAFGFKEKSVFVMIAGMPNVGKTQLIRNISGRKKLRVANRPGVTRAEQWITYGNLRIMDTPGVLYPELEDENMIYKLAILNSVDPSKIGFEYLMEKFWDFMDSFEKSILCDFYHIEKCETVEDFYSNFIERNGHMTNGNIACKVISDYNSGSYKNIVMDKL